MQTIHCVFITGAATGIGRAAARLFSKQGWFVGLADIDTAGLKALGEELGEAHCLTMALDVRDADAWHTALASFHRATGRLDVLLNNAGILISGPLEANTLERHQAVLDVNVKGVLNGCQLAKPYLQSTPGSRVINMSSAAAVYGQASLATYSASKFAVRALTEALNIEWQKDGIRVMDVMPLFVQTDMVTNMNARSIERMGVRLTTQDVARTIYAAATYQGSFGKVHWPVGFMATWLFRLTALGPDRLSRFVASRLAA
ncbi:SDR family oxidoreductase [Rhodoferax sp. GW822-FHT02A01]|uniref:SDR family oxidoreductase n=1 Tax=Rhodoferax sp. GW822-FHT02A01 TaxID=3141537 RepID=UPI00315D58A0